MHIYSCKESGWRYLDQFDQEEEQRLQEHLNIISLLLIYVENQLIIPASIVWGRNLAVRGIPSCEAEEIERFSNICSMVAPKDVHWNKYDRKSFEQKNGGYEFFYSQE